MRRGKALAQTVDSTWQSCIKRLNNRMGVLA
jgi:hypothetical protein